MPQTVTADIGKDVLAALDALDMATGWGGPELRVWEGGGENRAS
jgi:hypothetical protein